MQLWYLNTPTNLGDFSPQVCSEDTVFSPLAIRYLVAPVSTEILYTYIAIRIICGRVAKLPALTKIFMVAMCSFCRILQ